MLMPRTIDKLRAKLPGGDPGEYFINGPIPGISGFLLTRLGVTEEALLDVVGRAKDDEEVAEWLRAHVDVSHYEKLNAAIGNVEPEHAADPALVRRIYAEVLRAEPNLSKIVDILDADDRRVFGT
jgi:hypothetical protein